nr:hypothetical protein [Streptomyces sp. 11-1-2]
MLDVFALRSSSRIEQVVPRHELAAAIAALFELPAKLLDGEAWEQTKPTVLASLNLPADAGEHLAARAALLDGTYREVAARVPANSQIVFDDGRLHFAALEPEPEPASLRDLREAVEAMLPRVDLPEALLEVFSWTGADQAFTSITGGEARLKDLHVTITALLLGRDWGAGGRHTGWVRRPWVGSARGSSQSAERRISPASPHPRIAHPSPLAMELRSPARKTRTALEQHSVYAEEITGRDAERLSGQDPANRPRSPFVRSSQGRSPGTCARCPRISRADGSGRHHMVTSAILPSASTRA